MTTGTVLAQDRQEQLPAPKIRKTGTTFVASLNRYLAMHILRPDLAGDLLFADCLTALVILMIVTMLSSSLAHADNPLNGASRRPFYVFAHNPNTLAEAESALSYGANALEPDVQVDGSGNLVVAHDPYESGNMSIEDYLGGLFTLTSQYLLALLVLDVKSEAATADNGMKIVRAIHDQLRPGGRTGGVYVIISVATRNDGAVFDKIIGPNAEVQLGVREGVQVDQEDDAEAIVKFFKEEKGYLGNNIGYGDGTAGPGPNLPAAIDGAVGLRAAFGYPQAVTYVYTLNDPDTMRLYIDAGVDGIIPDCIFPFHPPMPFCPESVEALKSLVTGRTDIRMATLNDNPFKPLNEAYALKIRTMDETGAGTDANITFTLTGSLGSASITVNAAVPGRMESGSENWVTIPSKNLGALTSITISVGGGVNFPAWHLQDITVYSAHWLGPNVYTGAGLHQTIDDGSPVTLQLPVDEYVWGGFGVDQSVTPIHWQKFADAYKWVSPGGTIHVASGRYDEKLTLTKPCTLKFWADHGSNPATIGSP